jgi:hypothetical protein
MCAALSPAESLDVDIEELAGWPEQLLSSGERGNAGME